MAFVLTFLQVDKRLRQDGFEFSHARGSHYHYKHSETGKRVVVPRPSRKRTISLQEHYEAFTDKPVGNGEVDKRLVQDNFAL